MAARIGRGCRTGRARRAGTARAASAVRGAVVEGLHSSDLAASRRRGEGQTRGRERIRARRARGEHERTIRSHKETCSFLSRSRRVFFFTRLNSRARNTRRLYHSRGVPRILSSPDTITARSVYRRTSKPDFVDDYSAPFSTLGFDRIFFKSRGITCNFACEDPSGCTARRVGSRVIRSNKCRIKFLAPHVSSPLSGRSVAMRSRRAGARARGKFTRRSYHVVHGARDSPVSLSISACGIYIYIYAHTKHIHTPHVRAREWFRATARYRNTPSVPSGRANGCTGGKSDGGERARTGGVETDVRTPTLIPNGGSDAVHVKGRERLNGSG